jgi:Flp pilus assembly pilin Flp
MGLANWKEERMLRRIRGLWRNENGQDLIEYALLAATLAVVVAGFLPPALMPAVSGIFSKISSSMSLS